jgi:bla regulator protein BlaR1
MNAIGQSNFLQALGWAVLNSLWQMALLWIVFQIVTSLFKRINPSQKSALASSFLIGGFAWFVITFCSIFVTASATATGTLIDFESNPEINQWLTKTLPVASLVYLGLLLFPVLQFARNYRYVQVIRKYGISKIDVEWRMFVRKVAAQMGIRKNVRIWLSEFVSSPVTIGYLKPVILLPLAAMNNLSQQQVEAILLHELAHIRRADYFINLLLKFIQSILYFNPFVKAFVKIVEREREKSCDQMVIQYQYDPHGYASALLQLERTNNQPRPLALAASGKKNDLLHRIELIMGVKKEPAISFNKIAGVFAGMLCFIGFNAIVILSNPGADESLKQTYALSPVSSLYWFSDEGHPPTTDRGYRELPSQQIIANTQRTDALQANTAARIASDDAVISEEHASSIENLVHPFIVAAAQFDKPETPKLKQYQEAQVKGAMAASKRLIEESQWKEVERKFADVFTQQQKDELKSVYMKEMNKLDMKKWEEKLRLAYNQVDWDRVNIELNNAVASVRIDSLSHIYDKALTNLTEVQAELTNNNVNSIPDTDLSLQNIEKSRKELEKAIVDLKAVKNRKIVRL